MIDVEDSEIYKKIREHRSKCPKWGKGFCLDCFGGGLTRFTNKFIEEDISKRKQ